MPPLNASFRIAISITLIIIIINNQILHALPVYTGVSSESKVSERRETDETIDAPAKAAPGASSQEKRSRLKYESRDATPRLTFEPRVLDFGFIRLGERATGTALVRNDGLTPLTILGGRAACGCTSLEIEEGITLAPGETTPVTATFKPSSKLGRWRTSLRVVVDQAGFFELPVFGEVTRTIRTVPPRIDFRGGDQVEITLQALDNVPFRVQSVHGNVPRYSNNQQGVEPGDAATLHTLLVDVPPGECKTFPRWLIIETDHPELPLVDLGILHNCTELSIDPDQPWRVTSRHVILDGLQSTASVDFDFPVKVPHESDVPDFRTPLDGPDYLRAELIGVDRVAEDLVRCRVRVTCDALPRHLVQVPLRMTTTGEEEDYVWVTIRGGMADEADVAPQARAGE